MKIDKIKDFALQYQSDASFRASVDADPRAALEKIGMPIPGDTKIEFIQSTDSTTYVALPQDPNDIVSDENLADLAAGSGASCFASWASCLSSYDIADVQ